MDDIYEVSFKDSNATFGCLVGTMTDGEPGAEFVSFKSLDGNQQSLRRSYYTFRKMSLDEVERVVGRRNFAGKTNIIPPTRMLATIRAIETLKREGVSEQTLSDPDKLYGLLTKNFVLFNLLSEYERRVTIDTVSKKMKLTKEDNSVEALAIITDVLSGYEIEANVAEDMLAAINCSTLSEVAERFTDVSSEAMADIFIKLIENKMINDKRIAEIGRCQAVASILLKKKLTTK